MHKHACKILSILRNISSISFKVAIFCAEKVKTDFHVAHNFPGNWIQKCAYFACVFTYIWKHTRHNENGSK